MKAKHGFPLLLLFLVPLLLLPGCSLLSGDGSDDTPARTTEQETLLSALEAYDLAVNELTPAYGDVYLYELWGGASATFGTSLEEHIDDNGRASHWDLTFNQLLSDEESYVFIGVWVDNGEVNVLGSGDSEPVPADLDSRMEEDLVDIHRCSISGSEAVRIADEDGGRDYTRLRLMLLNDGTGCPEWIVVYGPALGETGEQPGVTFHISGETGEITYKRTDTYNVR